MLDKDESALLIRVDERQRTMRDDMETLRSEVAGLRLQQEQLIQKVDKIINRSIGGYAVLMSIGGVIVWIAEKMLFK